MLKQKIEKEEEALIRLKLNENYQIIYKVK
jgi:hypothetical protein